MKEDSVNLAMNFVCIIAPIIGFVPQIIRNRILFSPLLSFIVILSNILRIYYWQLERFEFCLVIQSIVLIFLHNLLIAMYGEELSRYESRFFKNFMTKKTHKKKGLFLAHLQLIATVGFLVYTLHCLVSGKTALFICKYTSFFLDMAGSVLQFLLAKYDEKSESSDQKKEQPKELFFCWILGDIIKFVWLLRMNTPLTIVGSVVFQLFFNFLLFFRE